MQPLWRTVQAERKSRHPDADAYRIWPAGRSGLPAVDVYGAAAVVWMQDDSTQNLPHEIQAQLDLTGVVIKRRQGRGFSNRTVSVLGHVPDVIEVREGPCRFACRLKEDGPTGLYLDLAPTRLRFAERFDGGQVLNLFAYTGTFSTHAAVCGADRVTSVDASRRALRWARDNFGRSGIDPDAHRWFDDDAITHLRRVEDASCDWVICDPPAFGRAGSRQFKLRRDLLQLVHESVRVTRRNLILTTHDPSVGPNTLRASVQEAARTQNKPVADMEAIELPPSFRGPDAHHLAGCWVAFR